MDLMARFLLNLAMILGAANTLYWLYILFTTNILWGIICIIFPPAGIVFLIKHFDRAKWCFLISILVSLIGLAGFGLAFKSNGNTFTWLFNALEHDRLEKEKLLNRHFRVDSSYPKSEFEPSAKQEGPSIAEPIGQAARHGNIQAVQDYLKNGGDVNAASKLDGWTPLMEASAFGQVEMVQFLLKSGADPSMQDHRGRTALSLAQGNQHARVVAILESSDEQETIR